MARKGRRVQEKSRLNTWALPAALALLLGALVIVLVTQGGGSSEQGDVTGASHAYHPVGGFDHMHGMALDPADPDRIYVATHNGLMRGVDGAWARVGDVADDLMGFTMHPTDADTFWVSGHPATGGNMGVRQSTDGGFTWTTVWAESVDFHAMTVSPADADSLWGSFAGRLYRSTDGGHAWSVVTDSPPRVFALAGDPEDADTVYGTTTGGVVRSTDGGGTWEPFADVAAAGFAVGPAGSGVMYAAAEDFHRSTDGGVTWTTSAESAFDGGLAGYLDVHPEDPETVVAGTLDGGVYRTVDGGASWAVLKPRVE